MIVTIEEPVVGFGLKDPEIPAGQPEADRVTAELKPLAGVTVTVEEPLVPACTVAAVAPRVKLGVGVPTANVPNCCQGPDL